MITFQRLSLANFSDYEQLTAKGYDGNPCFCSFWYMNCTSRDAYEAIKRDYPDCLRDIVRTRIIAGFHVGVLAYVDTSLAAWISVAPLPEVFWAWRRTAALGKLIAAITAAITCFTIAPNLRGKGYHTAILEGLKEYGKKNGWTAIEAYPFEENVSRVKPYLGWAGYETVYRHAGFSVIAAHWLSQPPEYTRNIVSVSLT